MGRFWLGIGLLVGLLALGLWVSTAMNGLHSPISQTLETAAQRCLAGDTEGGVSLSRQAQHSWQTHWRCTASVADHTPMEEIDGLFAQTEAYAKAGQWADFASHCARLAKLVEAVGEAHSLNWWNLL